MNANTEFQEKFINETLNLVGQYEQVIQNSESLSAEDFSQLFRIIHCVKGNAAAVGYSEIAQYAHHFEEQFVNARHSRDLINNKPLLLQFAYKIRYYINFTTMNKVA